MATQRILIPTDFSVVSLNMVKSAIEKSDASTIEIILVSGYHLSTSISELLFFSKLELLRKIQNTEFTEACRIIKSRYQSRLKSLETDLLISDNKRYVQLFLESNQINLIVIPEPNKLQIQYKKGFDLTPALSKTNYPVLQTEWPNENLISTSRLSDLFLSV